MRFFQEFKQFISKGNVIDIAVAFIIGAAFGKISASLVSDIIMPPIGLLISNVNFDQLLIPLKEVPGEVPVGIYYGRFFQTVLNFIIIAFAVFLLVKVVAKFKKKEKETPPPPAIVKTDETVLLEEIRDLLKNKN